MTSSLVFCVGPMTILGSIQDGLTGDYQLLLMKSFLDLFSSMAFAATLGVGVVCSAATLLLFQGGLTLAAGTIEVSLFNIRIGGVAVPARGNLSEVDDWSVVDHFVTAEAVN